MRAAVDKKIEALTQKMEKTVNAQRFDQIGPMTKEIEVLFAEKNRLLGGGENQAAMAAVQSQADKDTHAEFEVSFNAAGENVSAFKPVKAGGADKTFRMTHQAGGNPVDETALFFGAWGVSQDGTIAPSGGSLQGRAASKVHTVLARVRADPARAAGLLKAVNLAALKAALGGG